MSSTDKYFKFSDITETIPFKFDHLKVGGVSKITAWDDTTGFIEMKPFELNLSWEQFRNIEHDNFIKLLKDNINDNGFGCKDIVGAYIWIKAVYIDNRDNAAERYIDNMYVGVSRELTATDINQFDNYLENMD